MLSRKIIVCLLLLIILIQFISINQIEYFENNLINFIHIPKNAGTSIKELCNNKLKYNGHGTDVFNKNIKNQLIILRNPVERLYQQLNTV